MFIFYCFAMTCLTNPVFMLFSAAPACLYAEPMAAGRELASLTAYYCLQAARLLEYSTLM